MKKTLKNSVLMACILSISACFFSCKKFLEVDQPINQLTTVAVFSDSASIESAVNGYYGSITDNFIRFLHGRLTVATSLAADDIYAATVGSTPNVFMTNAIPGNNSENLACWTEAYRSIYHANSILENLQKTDAISKNLKAKISAEMKTMRAMNYFYLVNLYGPVPLVLTTAYNTNRLLPRASEIAVYDQILADLHEAQSAFVSQIPIQNKSRVNKWIVAALLARVYLFKKDFPNAITQTTAVINSGQFNMPPLNNAFLINSPEVIFQIMPSIGGPYNSGEGYAFIPSSATVIPAYALRQECLSVFENGDGRRAAWIASNTVNGTVYYYPAKYKVKQQTPYTSKTEYDVVLRLAEQYLIRAEAYAQAGNSTLAIKDLDAVRSRAGLSLLSVTSPGLSGPALFDAIAHERKTELFAEWGHRWFDLKRTNRADAVLGAIKGNNWQTTDQLFPIPESELIAAPNLTQNEGY